MTVNALGKSQIAWEDIVVIVVYFLFVLGVGFWSSHRSKRDSISGYFLAGRNMNWLLVGASLYASNTGSGQFVGLAGSGAASGIAIAMFEFNALYVLLLLGWCFVPVYMAAGVYTMPEYLRKRFGGQRIRVYLSVLALILYIFTKISADLFAGAMFIEKAMNWDMYSAIILLLAISAVFTISGGLTAVIWTDFIQTILMVGGAIVLTFYSFDKAGGYDKVVNDYMHAEANSSLYANSTFAYENCGKVPGDAMHFFRSVTSPDLPWTGITFGLTVSAVWYWCSDQVIVQRALAAKSISHAKAGTILAGYIKILPLYILVFPGMIARILFKDVIACASPEECEKACGSASGCTNVAYPMLVINVLPKGLVGLMLAVMMAALVSSLTSIFNSSSTLFTIDIWKRFRKNASDIELLIVGRAFVLVLVILSILWIPIIKGSQNSQLFNYIQSITSYLAPPVCAVYVLAIFWGRINEKGAFWGLMLGLIIGLIRFGLEFGFPAPPCGSADPDLRPEFVKQAVSKVHYLHFGIILFVIVALIATVVSLLTEPIDRKHLHRLTFWTRHDTEPRIDLDTEEHQPTNKVGDITSIQQTGSTISIPTNSTEQLALDAEEVHLPGWRKVLNFVCGIQTQDAGNKNNDATIITPEEEAKIANEFLKEKPSLKRLCNINAVIAMVLCAFLIGFYA